MPCTHMSMPSCMPIPLLPAHSQVLKVWDLVEFRALRPLLGRLERMLRVYTPEALERCTTILWAEEPASSGSAGRRRKGRAIPKSWPHDPHFAWLRQGSSAAVGQGGAGGSQGGQVAGGGGGDAAVLEESDVEGSMLLRKFYALSARLASLLCRDKGGTDLEGVFKMNAEEVQVLEYPK